MFDYRMGTHNYIITMKRHYWYETSSTTMNHHWPVFIITIITIITNHHYEKSLAMSMMNPELFSISEVPGADPRTALKLLQDRLAELLIRLGRSPGRANLLAGPVEEHLAGTQGWTMGSRWSKRTLTWHKVNSMDFFGPWRPPLHGEDPWGIKDDKCKSKNLTWGSSSPFLVGGKKENK